MSKLFEGVDLNEISDEAAKKADESLKQEIKKATTVEMEKIGE